LVSLIPPSLKKNSESDIQKRVNTRLKKRPLPSLTRDAVGIVAKSKHLPGKDKISRDLRGLFFLLISLATQLGEAEAISEQKDIQ